MPRLVLDEPEVKKPRLVLDEGSKKGPKLVLDDQMGPSFEDMGKLANKDYFQNLPYAQPETEPWGMPETEGGKFRGRGASGSWEPEKPGYTGLTAWKPSIRERVKNYINDTLEKSPFVEPGKRLGQLGVHHFAESISGLGIYIPDVLAKAITKEDTLAEAVDKVTGFVPTPRDVNAGEAAKFITSLETVGLGIGKVAATIPARQALKSILSTGVTFGTRGTIEEIAEKITKNDPIDVEGIHFESGIGILFGAGEVGLSKFANFITGVKRYDKFTQRVTPKAHADAARKSARAEINAALKTRESNPAEWQRVMKKYAGWGTSGQAKPAPIPAGKAKVKGFGKYPIAPAGEVAPPVTPPPITGQQPDLRERLSPEALERYNQLQKAKTVPTEKPPQAPIVQEVTAGKPIAETPSKPRTAPIPVPQTGQERIAKPGKAVPGAEGVVGEQPWKMTREEVHKKPERQITEKDIEIEHYKKEEVKGKMGGTPIELYKVNLPNGRKLDVIRSGREWMISGYTLQEANYGGDKFGLVYNETSRKKQVQKIIDAYNAGFLTEYRTSHKSAVRTALSEGKPVPR